MVSVETHATTPPLAPALAAPPPVAVLKSIANDECMLVEGTAGVLAASRARSVRGTDAAF